MNSATLKCINSMGSEAATPTACDQFQARGRQALFSGALQLPSEKKWSSIQHHCDQFEWCL